MKNENPESKTQGGPASARPTGSVALVAEPVTYSIAESELREWLRHVREGMEPEVPFKMDNNEMLAAAYELRGNMLYYLNHRLDAILNYGVRTQAPQNDV